MQKHIFPKVVTFLLLSSIWGCNRSARLERNNAEDISLAKNYFDLLRKGDYDEVENAFDPSLKGPDFRAGFDQLVATIPPEDPFSVSPNLVKRNCDAWVCDTGIILDYKYRDERLLFNVVLRKSERQSTIIGMNIRIIPGSYIAANEFRLSNKGFFQYAMLILAVLFPALSVYALALCIRSRIGLRKWLWTPFIIVGVAKLGVNWTTGRIDFHVLSVQVLSSSAFREPYGPWIISVSLPLGAILFLTHRTLQARTRCSIHS